VAQFAAQGVLFTNATALKSGAVGGSLNEFDFPPHSGVTVVGLGTDMSGNSIPGTDNTQPMIVTFLAPHTSVSGWVTYTDPLTLKAFDPAGNLLAILNSSASSNLGSNENFLFAGIGQISSIQISEGGSPGSRAFMLDDLQATPEPTSLVLLASGVGAVWLRRSRRSRKLLI